MDKREVAAQIAKELAVEYLRKYPENATTISEVYKQFFDTVLECLEGDTEINVKFVE